MEYEQLTKGYDYGLSKIYEMVINNDPCYAYLMRVQLARRPEAGDGPRLRPLRLLQEQRLVQPHQPQDDGRDGQPRHPHPPLHRTATASTRSRTSSTAACRIEDLIDIHSPVHQAARRRRARRPGGGRGRGRRPRPLQDRQGLHGRLHQPAGVPRGASGRSSTTSEQKQKRFPERAGARRAAVPARARAAQALAARRAVDHPRRGLLLRPAGPDQDHERGLGQLLALDDHDPARRCEPSEIIDYCRPSLGHDGHAARRGSIPTSSASSCSATSRTAGTTAASARSTTSATTSTPSAHWDTQARAWAGRRSSRSAASTTT